MYVITGATGHIGKLVTTELLNKGKKVRVIARNVSNLNELSALGAEPLPGDVNDPDFVIKAFAGATAVFCLIPPILNSTDIYADQKRIADNYLAAVKANAVKNVILLSSVGAHLRKGAGIVDGLGYLEEIFSELPDVNVLNLRPSYFMENLFGQIGVIKHYGVAGSAINGEILFPIVATKDIASKAAQHILNLDFKGNTIKYILGQRDITYNEIAQIIGNAIEKPELNYVQFSYEDSIDGMVSSGFCSENVAEAMAGLAAALNYGELSNGEERNAETTTPTSIEEFAQEFAYVYNNS